MVSMMYVIQCTIHNVLLLATCTMQKKVSCFNHRVVTLVADKLKRQWVCIILHGKLKEAMYTVVALVMLSNSPAHSHSRSLTLD